MEYKLGTKVNWKGESARISIISEGGKIPDGQCLYSIRVTCKHCKSEYKVNYLTLAQIREENEFTTEDEWKL